MDGRQEAGNGRSWRRVDQREWNEIHNNSVHGQSQAQFQCPRLQRTSLSKCHFTVAQTLKVCFFLEFQ